MVDRRRDAGSAGSLSSDDRPKAVVACWIAFAVGSLVIVGTLVFSGNRLALAPLLLFGFLALLIGVFLVLVLAKDPYRRGARPRAGEGTKAHYLNFTVGEHEMHRIVYRWDQTWGWLTVTVDDALVVRRLVTLSVSLVRVVEFDAGEQEKHHVRIEKRRSLFVSFARPQPIEAFIDGVPLATRGDSGTV
ncbi:hypothetical protein [Herbiconiux sp.]|uniref:hypothetical protein n=1 Tax=Herbiconiux sp. TaxID=1871186 RepID=UPI0025BC5E96|nr:hypothetical protein [Herbiconiux sp.]